MFETGQNTLVFFFGIFWATLLSTVPVYRLFVVGKSIWRWIVGIISLNLYPLILLFILFEVSPYISNQQGTAATFCAAIMSLSVFSSIFILRAIISCYFDKFNYDDNEKSSLKEKLSIPEKSRRTLIVALVYLFGWPLIAFIIGSIFSK